MSDDFKAKLYLGLTTALVSGIMSFAGMEKSESDSTAKSGGKSWIGTNFAQHTAREDELQRQIDDLRSQINQEHYDKRNSSGR